MFTESSSLCLGIQAQGVADDTGRYNHPFVLQEDGNQRGATKLELFDAGFFLGGKPGMFTHSSLLLGERMVALQ